MGDFYGTGIEIWARYGRVGITEKKLGQLSATFEAGFFMFSWAKKNSKSFFAPEYMKKPPSKVAHYRPKPFFSVLPIGLNPAQISIPVP